VILKSITWVGYLIYVFKRFNAHVNQLK